MSNMQSGQLSKRVTLHLEHVNSVKDVEHDVFKFNVRLIIEKWLLPIVIVLV